MSTHGEQPGTNPERLYIHVDTFLGVAQESTEAAMRTGWALAATRVARTVGHHIEQAVDLGAATPKEADSVMGWFVTERDFAMGGLLRSCMYVPKIPYRPGSLRRVLQADQTIVNSCAADGYYTFATTSAAADRMFDDTADMGSVNTALASSSKLEDLERVSNLVVIRGDNMMLAADASPEQLASRSYRPERPLSVGRVKRIEEQCRIFHTNDAMDQLELQWIRYAWADLPNPELAEIIRRIATPLVNVMERYPSLNGSRAA